MSSLLGVVTSLRKLNAEIEKCMDLANNLVEQIIAISKVDQQGTSTALLYLSLSEEVDSLQTLLDQLDEHIRTTSSYIEGCEYRLSTTFIPDVIFLLSHMQTVRQNYEHQLDALRSHPLPSDSQLRPTSLIADSYDLIIALQRIRGDLCLAQQGNAIKDAT